MPNLTDFGLHRSAFPAVLSAQSRMLSVKPIWGGRLNVIVCMTLAHSLLKAKKWKDWQQWWFSLSPSLGSTCREWDTSNPLQRHVGGRSSWAQQLGDLNLRQGTDQWVQKYQVQSTAFKTTWHQLKWSWWHLLLLEGFALLFLTRSQRRRKLHIQ